MSIELSTPSIDGLGSAVRALRDWQQDEGSVQLHPGDLGWNWRFGAQATAAAVRTWSRDGRILALGLVDSPGLLRLAVAPAARDDEELARQLVSDVTRPERGVLAPGDICVEARGWTVLQELLTADGWGPDEPWTPLRRDLAEPVEDCGVRIEVTGPERAAVQRAAFDRSIFTAERWHAMAAGPAYADARCLVAYDDEDTPVAAATVWSAGPGRRGLREPMGVHRDHRGHGYGTAITVAAAAALQALGSSSAVVCTPSANVGGVATYVSAGFHRLPDVPDLRRGA